MGFECSSQKVEQITRSLLECERYSVKDTVKSLSVNLNPQSDWLPPVIFLQITAGLRPLSARLFVGSTPSS